MDKSTHEVRSKNWADIISQCQSRPEGQTVKQWLLENNVPEKSYYYWLRKFRKHAYDSIQEIKPPALSDNSSPSVAFAEIPVEEIVPRFNDGPAITIKTKKLMLEISAAIPAESIVELVKAVAHAL